MHIKTMLVLFFYTKTDSILYTGRILEIAPLSGHIELPHFFLSTF